MTNGLSFSTASNATSTSIFANSFALVSSVFSLYESSNIFSFSLSSCKKIGVYISDLKIGGFFPMVDFANP